MKRVFSLKSGRTEQQAASPTKEAVAELIDEIPKPTDPAPTLMGKETNMNTTDVTTSASRVLPSFDQLPKFHELNGCAWGVWGKDDELGTINMLTEEVVQRAAREEVRYVVCTFERRPHAIVHRG